MLHLAHTNTLYESLNVMKHGHQYQLKIQLIRETSEIKCDEEIVRIIVLDSFLLGILKVELHQVKKYLRDPIAVLNSFIEQYGKTPELVRIFTKNSRFNTLPIQRWAEITFTPFSYHAPTRYQTTS
jgi:hypothetical protein